MLSPIRYPKLSKKLRTVRIQDAAAEPVSLADYKLYVRQANLNIPQAAFDVKVRAARRLCEQYSGRAFVSQMFNAVLDLPPGIETSGGGFFGSVLARFEGYIPTPIELLYPPLRQVGQIFVTDDNAAITVVPASSYWVSTANEPARIALRQTQVWPDTLGRVFETFTVQYTAGYAIPFTAAGATLSTLQPHGLVNGQIERAWTTSDGRLPAGLSGNTDYYVVNATSNSFGLSATSGGAAIVTTDAGTGTSFFGAIPGNFLRAILATAAVDFYPEKKKTSRFDVAESGALPDLARELLGMDRILNL